MSFFTNIFRQNPQPHMKNLLEKILKKSWGLQPVLSNQSQYLIQKRQENILIDRYLTIKKRKINKLHFLQWGHCLHNNSPNFKTAFLPEQAPGPSELIKALIHLWQFHSLPITKKSFQVHFSHTGGRSITLHSSVYQELSQRTFTVCTGNSHVRHY